MELTTAATPKRSRSKAPVAVAMPNASPVAPPADLTDMIATAAYFLAADRDFTPGHELDDWLEAERRVHALVDG